jgi:hypothetical protein
MATGIWLRSDERIAGGRIRVRRSTDCVAIETFESGIDARGHIVVRSEWKNLAMESVSGYAGVLRQVRPDAVFATT